MKQTLIDPNPPRGEKATFRKMTVTVPPEIYERLVRESARRKIAGEPNQMLSALLREAVTKYLDVSLDRAVRRVTGPRFGSSP